MLEEITVIEKDQADDLIRRIAELERRVSELELARDHDQPAIDAAWKNVRIGELVPKE